MDSVKTVKVIEIWNNNRKLYLCKNLQPSFFELVMFTWIRIMMQLLVYVDTIFKLFQIYLFYKCLPANTSNVLLISFQYEL